VQRNDSVRELFPRASCLPESSGRALVADAREDSPVSDALLSIPEKRDAYLSPSRFSTYETQHYARPDLRRRRRKALVCEETEGREGITTPEVLRHFGVTNSSRRKRSRMSAWASLCASRSRATMVRNWSLVKSSIRRYSSKGTNRCVLRYRSSMRERLVGLACSFLPRSQAQRVHRSTLGGKNERPLR
jgi:hypothetical protein